MIIEVIGAFLLGQWLGKKDERGPLKETHQARPRSYAPAPVESTRGAAAESEAVVVRTMPDKGGAEPLPASSDILAAAVAKEIEEKGPGADKGIVAAYQASRGDLKIDGLYGPKTAQSVADTMQEPAPPPVYRPKGRTPKAGAPKTSARTGAPKAGLPRYRPGATPKKPAPKGTKPLVAPVGKRAPGVPSKERLDRATELASVADASLRSKGQKYDRAALKAFQEAADLKPDGIYGGTTAGAIGFYLGQSPVLPFSAPMTVQPYRPKGL